VRICGPDAGFAGTGATVGELQSSSAKVAVIIKTIDQIAFQTNILALNAAVEAARAGEAGAGFAVVADEVRALAEQSARAAEETSDRLSSAISKSEASINASSRLSESLSNLEHDSASIAEILESIETRSDEVANHVSEISKASSKQRSSLEEVVESLILLSQAAGGHAAKGREAERLSQELLVVEEALLGGIKPVLDLVAAGHPPGQVSPRQSHGAPLAPLADHDRPELDLPVTDEDQVLGFGDTEFFFSENRSGKAKVEHELL